MLRFTRTIVRRFWGIFAFLLISLAVLVTVGRELMPYVDKYKGELEIIFEDAVGVDVSIESVEGVWRGLQPELRLRGVTLTSDSGNQLLAVNTLRGRVSLIDSLLNWDLVIGKFELVQVEMSLVQQDDHSWTLRGLDSQPLSDDNLASGDPLDRFLAVNEIEFRDAEIEFEFSTGHLSHISLPNLLLQNSGDFHRFASEVAVDDQGEVMTLIVEGNGDPRNVNEFTAKGYVRLQNFELEKAIAALPGELWQGLPNKEWREGHLLDFEAWFDVLPGMEVITRGRVDVGEPPVSFVQDLLFPNQSGANFAASWNQDGSWEISLRDILLAWGDYAAPSFDVLVSSPQLGQPVNVQTAEIDLEVWLPRLKEIGIAKGEALAALNDLDPKGVLENVQLKIEGTNIDAIRLQTNLKRFSVESYNGAPKLENVNGYLEASPLAGYIDVDAKDDFSMLYPTVYKHAFELSNVIGRVHWNIDLDERAVNVHSGLVTAESKFGEVSGYFSLFVPFAFGSEPEELVIQLGVKNSHAKFQKELVPYVVPQVLRDWLDDNIHSGDVAYGGFIYRGGFTPELMPYTSLQLFVDVDNGRVSYHPSWPELHSVSSNVWLDDTTVYADTERAKVYDTELKRASVSVDVKNAESIDIHVSGDSHGTLGDATKFLNDTPLQGMVGRYFDAVDLDGNLSTHIALSLPLHLGDTTIDENQEIMPLDLPQNTDREALTVEEPVDSAPQLRFSDGAKHRIVGVLDKVSMRHPASNIIIENIAGEFTYHESDGIHADALRATLWGSPLRGSVTTTDFLGDNQSISIFAKGDVHSDNVAEWLGVGVPSFIEGHSSVAAEFQIGVDPDTVNAIPDVSLFLQSDLSQLALDVPEPFAKQAESEMPVSLRLAFGSDITESAFNLQNPLNGNQLNGKLQLDEKQIKQIVLGVNSEAHLKNRDGWFVEGGLNALNYSEWETFIFNAVAYWQDSDPAVESEKARALYPIVDLQVESLDFHGFFVDDIAFNVERTDNTWQVDLNSATVAGLIKVSQDGEPLELNLDYFHLQNSQIEDGEIASVEKRPPPDLATLFAIQDSDSKNDEKDPLESIDPKSLPAMSVAVKQFTIDGDDFGEWAFKVAPTDTGVEVTELIATVKNAHINGPNQSGAKIWWDQLGQRSRSRFQGVLMSSDLGKVLEDWGQPSLVESEDAVIVAELNWDGSPANISTINIEGDVSIRMQRGAFSTDDSQAGASGALLQLISFFNVDSWLRRLRYSFSDLGREGMPYHNIEGQLSFDHGDVNINEPLIIDTPSGRFQIAGNVNLVDEDVDAVLTATLPVGGNLTLVTAFAAGLPAAVGVYLISKVFEKQVDKVASLRYEVRGSLNDPELKFERVSDKMVIESPNTLPDVPSENSTESELPESAPDDAAPEMRGQEEPASMSNDVTYGARDIQVAA